MPLSSPPVGLGGLEMAGGIMARRPTPWRDLVDWNADQRVSLGEGVAVIVIGGLIAGGLLGGWVYLLTHLTQIGRLVGLR